MDYVIAFLLEGEGGLTLVDTGVPSCEDKILGAVAELRPAPQEVKNIRVTHLHTDQSGSFGTLPGEVGELVAGCCPAVLRS